MDEYLLKISSIKIPFDEILSFGVSPMYYSFIPNQSSVLILSVSPDSTLYTIGLGSEIQILQEDIPVYTGLVYSEDIYFDGKVRRKELKAIHLIDLADFVDAVDVIGVPKIELANISMGSAIKYLLDNSASKLKNLGLAANDFYEQLELDKLAEEIDYISLENETIWGSLRKILDSKDIFWWIDSEDKVWRFRRVQDLPIEEFSVDEDYRLMGFKFGSNLSQLASAVKIVSGTNVKISYAQATPAWDSQLEDDWSLRVQFYSAPDDDKPNEQAYVYRRFSYADIPNLLENYPIELVQKVQTEDGNTTYKIVETQSIDRENKTILAKYPILEPPQAKRINKRNARIKGKANIGDVYIRYRQLDTQPLLQTRYPQIGFTGSILTTAGIRNERVYYQSKTEEITYQRAVELFRTIGRIEKTLILTLKGTKFKQWMFNPHRLKLIGFDDINISQAYTFLPIAIEIDFISGLTRLELKLID